MKNTSKIAMACLLGVALVACDRHDKLDDIVFVGEMAPHVTWSIASTTARAGANVEFQAQYYTTIESPLSHLEVWYNVLETESKNVAVPWVVSQPYTIVTEVQTEKRIAQKISEYTHNEETWDGTKRAYQLTATFPTSNTLAPLKMTGSDYNEEKVQEYFGADFMQHFKDSLYQYLKANPDAAYKDFQKLVETDSIWKADYFTPYEKRSFDENTQQYYDHFVDHVIPYKLDSLYQTFTFKDLISTSTGDLSISYLRTYMLNAQLRCLDEKGTAGLTQSIEITLN